MCGRYTLIGDPRLIDRLSRAGIGMLPSDVLTGRYNVAPRQQIPMIERAEDGALSARTARWGLLPPSARSSRDRLQPINARAEKLFESKMWRPLIEPRSRVLLPADGYYEWMRAESDKEKPAPFFHQVGGGEWFSFAGLSTTVRVEDLEGPLTTAALITTEANEVAARVHDRMPAILAGPEAEAAWLSPEVSAEEAMALIQPLAPDRLTARPANRLVDSAANEGPALLDPEPDTLV